MNIDVVRIDHVQLPIPPGGESLARKFYGEILGLPEIPAPEALAQRGFFWYALAGIELHLGPEDDFHVSKRHAAFEVKNLADIRTYLLEKGVKISDTVPLPDRERFFVYDPFDNRIELIEFHPPS